MGVWGPRKCLARLTTIYSTVYNVLLLSKEEGPGVGVVVVLVVQGGDWGWGVPVRRMVKWVALQLFWEYFSNKSKETECSLCKVQNINGILFLRGERKR